MGRSSSIEAGWSIALCVSRMSRMGVFPYGKETSNGKLLIRKLLFAVLRRVNLQRVLFLPAVSFVCPVVPTWSWNGKELQPLAPCTLMHQCKVLFHPSHICRTLSDSEACADCEQE